VLLVIAFTLRTLNLEGFHAIFQFAHRSAALDAVGWFAAEYLPYALVAATVVYMMRTRADQRWSRLLVITSAILLSRVVITGSIHTFYDHPRPMAVLPITPMEPLAHHSFPSGHAAFFFALAGALWSTDRRWGWWFLAGALLNGLARILIGVHWPLDIVAGALIGLGSASVAHAIIDRRPRTRPF